ncbi:cardiolipin synthase [Polaribacter reichenbachii]|uniref:Cardiolipin synthase n=1 Tax=Polaribacter reichenbachii TaxID=996801 RepID=A0A1B8U5T6_9FLAO|nr:cardiolipin synthase [Polaribacter reichenbachii]APZ47840.1 cardiolipin synthase [Polaribacter reichenbachii]AUC18475.1 cardiolipin synthase [Polaribacter reichenbachii]OBY67212.1 cardiolipin synthase [Polaribacter reichenbachii]
MIFYVLGVLHFVLFSWAFYNVLYFGVKPSKSLSWILITFFFPFIGVFVFVLFGINRRKIKFFELKETKKRKKHIKDSFKGEGNANLDILETTQQKKISQLIYSSTNSNVEDKNEVVLLKNGKETFKALNKALKNAKKFIHLQYYMIEDGQVLDEIIEILAQKIKENIEVRIIYDTFGSYKLSKKSKRKLKDIDVKLYPETPFKFGSFLFSLNYRNHRKIAVIDNEIGFVGGVNISDEYITDDDFLGIWQDTHIQVKGCAVNRIHKTFLMDYYYATNKDLSNNESYLTPCNVEGNTKLQMVSSGPDYEQSVVMQQYLSFINLAEKSICVLNPYFIPTFSILEAFKMAALSGVEVTLLLPAKSDSKVANYSMYSYFEDLLKAGVHIYLREDFSHSKVIFIDDEIISIGSTNFDCRSFEHNYELNAILFDKKITLEVKDEFDERKNKANKIDYDTFRKRSIKQKTLERLCRFFSPLL